MSSNQADLDIGIGGAADPFATGAKGRGKIHVRIQQRNGRKCITTIQGLDADLDLGRIMKNMKKNCAWMGREGPTFFSLGTSTPPFHPSQLLPTHYPPPQSTRTVTSQWMRRWGR